MSTNGTFRVFLSAVSSEFERARTQLAQDLRSRCLTELEVKNQDEFRQEVDADTTLRKLHNYIKNCDRVVCIVGQRSGALPKEPEARPFVTLSVLPEDFPQASYTHWEFFFARHYAKKLSIYIANGYQPDRQAPAPDDSARLQGEFVEYLVEQGLDRSYFATADALCRWVLREKWPQTAGEVVPTRLRDFNVAAFRAHLKEYAAIMLDHERVRRVTGCDMELSGEHEGQRTFLAELWAKYPRLIVAGSPGSGKSVYLLRKFQELCRELQTSLDAPLESSLPVVPVFLELGRAREPEKFAEMLCQCLDLREERDPQRTLFDLLDRCSLVLLLDGINELPPNLRKPVILQLLELGRSLADAGKADRIRFILSTRPYGFDRNIFQGTGYESAEVLPLTPEEITTRLDAALPDIGRSGREVYESLSFKLRQLLANPQNLTYAIDWIRGNSQAGGDLARALRSRGKLLEHCARRRVERLDRATSELVARVLWHLAYGATDGGVHFSRQAVLDLIRNELVNEALKKKKAPVVLKKMLDAELLVQPDESDDSLRFVHHSIQQYFAASEMKVRWELDRYATDAIWHEPLVIMAGLLNDERRLTELFNRLRTDVKLYAYVVANVDQPERERELLAGLVTRFSAKVWRWARGLVVVLAAGFTGWFFSLPLLGFMLAVNGEHFNGPVVVVATIVDLIVIPLGLIRWHERRFKQAARRLSARDLPELMETLRYFDATGAMRTLVEELQRMLEKLCGVNARFDVQVGKDYRRAEFGLGLTLFRLIATQKRIKARSDDPRVAFLASAIETLEAAIRVHASYATEDEKLEQIADPLAFASVDAHRLEARHIDRLEAMAAGENAMAGRALEKLREVYEATTEHREQLAKMFRELALDYRNRQRRRQAVALCRRLGIPCEAPGVASKKASHRRLAVATMIVIAGWLVYRLIRWMF